MEAGLRPKLLPGMRRQRDCLTWSRPGYLHLGFKMKAAAWINIKNDVNSPYVSVGQPSVSRLDRRSTVSTLNMMPAKQSTNTHIHTNTHLSCMSGSKSTINWAGMSVDSTQKEFSWVVALRPFIHEGIVCTGHSLLKRFGTDTQLI